MITRIILTIFFIFSSLNAGTINVAVAANVSYAIDDLKKEFNKLYRNTKVRITLGGSGKLTAQIKHQAPYDIFMSANMQYPKTLYKENIAVTKPLIYAKGSLAILSVKKRDFTNGIDIVNSSYIKKIAIANPKTAPYGLATVEAMKNAKVYNNIKNKFVYGESISQTVSYAVISADIGFIAKSSLYSPTMSQYKKDINWVDIDQKLYTPIDQGIVILKAGENNSEVKAFYDFIQSKNAKDIFKKFGYLIP